MIFLVSGSEGLAFRDFWRRRGSGVVMIGGKEGVLLAVFLEFDIYGVL